MLSPQQTERASYPLTLTKNCSRCDLLETDEHLFFSCSFARAIWFASSPSLRSDCLPQAIQGIQHQLCHILPPFANLQEIQRVLTMVHLEISKRPPLQQQKMECFTGATEHQSRHSLPPLAAVSTCQQVDAPQGRFFESGAM